MRYSKYPSYRDSGVEWLGEIPEHWGSSRLKFLCNITTGGKDTENKVDDGEYPFYVRSQTVERINSYSFNGEAILTAGDGVGVGKVFHYAKGKFDFHQRVYMFYAFKQVIGKFLFEYIKNNFYKVALAGVAKSTVDSLRLPLIQNFMITIPPLQEQRTIANYLDKATAKIDTLIEKQTKLIELLREKRQAVISTAVTRGLDNTVAMKDSGVEWLGEIPEHWLTPKLKLFIKTTKGFAFKSDNFVEEGIPVVKMTEIKNGTINPSTVFLPKEFQTTHKQVLLSYKDIIVSTVGSAPEVKNSAVGQIGIVPEMHNGSLLNQNTVIYSPNRKRLSNSYLPYILQSQAYREHLDLHAHGTANQASLNLTDMLKFVFPCPPLVEQQAVANYIDDKTSKIDTLVTKATKAIDLLKEKRTALISAAVTGKIDVRENKNIKGESR